MYRTTHKKYKNYGDGIWFLKKRVCEKYYYNKDNGDYDFSVRTVLNINDDFEINIEIPDSIFNIQFPKGLQVDDERTGTTIVIE